VFQETIVNAEEFVCFRNKLNKTQKGIAELLGVSLNAIHSYEQGWRNIPGHVERQLLFLVFMKEESHKKRKPCWVVKGCAPEDKEKCPAYEFNFGHLCWFISGTKCEGTVQKDWNEKMKICRNCEMLKPLLKK
jgi:DNA-binding XRE family transcriptional regulator